MYVLEYKVQAENSSLVRMITRGTHVYALLTRRLEVNCIVQTAD